MTSRLIEVIERCGGPSAVAKKLGITPPAVTAWMHGSIPYAERRILLCEKLGINIRWLETGEGSDEYQLPERASNTMKEESATAKQNDDLARALAEMILGFNSLPPAYEAMALKQIEEHFAEFRRRAEMRAQVRELKHVSYDGGDHRRAKKHRP